MNGGYDTKPGNTARSGFTLVEIMIVVAIIGLLAAIAIPSFVKARHNSQKNAYINDMRIFRDAVQSYNLENKGQYPANTSPGVMPTALASYLTRFPWTQGPSIGGQWDWDYKTSSDFTAGLSVRNTIWTESDMQEVDAEIDDGSLNTGNFRKFNTDYTYIIE